MNDAGTVASVSVVTFFLYLFADCGLEQSVLSWIRFCVAFCSCYIVDGLDENGVFVKDENVNGRGDLEVLFCYLFGIECLLLLYRTANNGGIFFVEGFLNKRVSFYRIWQQYLKAKLSDTIWKIYPLKV